MRSHLLARSAIRSIAIVTFALGSAGCMEARREVPADQREAPAGPAVAPTAPEGMPAGPQTTQQVDSAMAPVGAPGAPEGAPIARDRAPASAEQDQDQDQGILRVSYPTSRNVFVNGERVGRTNRDLTVPATNLMVDLGEPRDYSPGSQAVNVSTAAPTTVSFTPRGQ